MCILSTQGRVLSDGDPIKGVNFVLFSRTINPKVKYRLPRDP